MKSKQYQGGAGKIQKVLKCSRARAQHISDEYDDLYRGVGEFNAKTERFAKANGYVNLAFGLKLKTPRINSYDTGIASAEVRSSCNAATQSYGMLMNRAMIEFDKRVEDAGYEYDIKLILTIHDALYLLVKDDPEIIAWVNTNLIECMEWQDDPELHSDIKLGAELDIGYSWDKQYTIPNHATSDKIAGALKLIKEKAESDEIKAYLKAA